MKEILIEAEGIYQHTRIWTDAIAPEDYNALIREIEISDEHSAIAESQSSNSYMEKEAFAFIAETLQDMTRRFEVQARVQKEQQEIFRVQQESIDDLKMMITQLLINQKKGSKPNTFFRKNQGE